MVTNILFLNTHRCLVGGDGIACKVTCKAQGYEEGICDETQTCTCGGGNSKWGDTIDKIEDIGQSIGAAIGDFFG